MSTPSAPRQDLELRSPWLNTAGSLGFAPPSAAWPWSQPQGAFVTAPISRAPRMPAAQPSLLAYPGGFLLHTGWPNAGFRRTVQKHARRWTARGLPVWVHLLAEDPSTLRTMLSVLETLEGVATVEIGLPPDADSAACLALVSAARGELPLVVCLPLDRIGESWVDRLPDLGVSALVLAAPRGCLLDPVSGRVVTGRLYGPGLFPQVLRALGTLQRGMTAILPLIAGCGVTTPTAGETLLSAGALAVQLDIALWSVRLQDG